MIKIGKGTYIRIRIEEKEKEYIFARAKKEGKTATQYILEKLLPEKYEALKKWEKELNDTLKESGD